MAKSKKGRSPEEQEMKEIKKRQAERDKKRKLRLKKKKKKLKKETKKINKIINLPFKLLFQLSLLGSSLSFIILYFGSQTELIKSLYYSFLVFSFLSLGFGFLMIVIFYFISEQKKQEIKKTKKKEEEELRRQEKEREEFMMYGSDISEPVIPPVSISEETKMDTGTMGISESPEMPPPLQDTSFDVEMPIEEQKLENEQMEEQFASEQNQATAEPEADTEPEADAEINLENMIESKLPE